ncbi:hypothetical protein [Mycobacterium sp. DBP42]|uniref:hypothetical protein n=1 Tax=Mycobacterium sp. DBP42 TaxID=2545267 RepID=UPI001041F789|nr:hypothetical protein [Mycobacterium sp. DBP42]TMS50399.1 hypothetical protein E0T84_24135 [Mycobacterium sp. DBP42]
MTSPDPQVVAQVAVDTLCEILMEGNPPQLKVYVRATGAVLGAITDRWDDMARCINADFSYEAVIITLRPVVRVRVQLRQDYRLPLPFAAVLVGIAPDLIAPAEGDEIELGVVDGHAVATALDGRSVGRIPAEPVAVSRLIRRGHVRMARVDAVSPDGTRADITLLQA